MAETRTTRMRLVQWSEGTDSPQRVDFNETFLNIENSAVVYERGKFADRPNPSKSGYLYEATDQAVLYYSDGLVWTVLGSNTYSQFSRALNSGTPALITQGIANQSSDIFQVQTSDAVSRFRVRNSGDLISGPLTVQHASRPSSAATTAAPDSGVTAEVATNVWALSAIVQAGNTTGIMRAIRGGSTVFQVKVDGALETVGNVSIGGALSVSGKVSSQTAPSADTDMVRLKELRDYAAGNAVTAYRVNAGTGLTGGGLLDKDVTLGVVFSSNAGDGTASVAARQDHQHDLSGDRLTGTLPVSKGGTGVTTIAALQAALGALPAARKILTGQGLSGGGDLTADRTISVNMLASSGKNGTDTNVARADHGHDLGDTNITGAVAVGKGGTGAVSAPAARTNLGAVATSTRIMSGDGINGGGDLTTDRMLSVNFLPPSPTAGSATSAARSDHTHTLQDVNMAGYFPSTGMAPALANAASAYGYWRATINNMRYSNGWPLEGMDALLFVWGQDNLLGQRLTYTDGREFTRFRIAGQWAEWREVDRNLLVAQSEQAGGTYSGKGMQIRAGAAWVTTDANGDATVTYKQPFPNGCVNVVLSPNGIDTGGARFVVLLGMSLTSFTFRSYSAGEILKNFSHGLTFTAIGW